VRESSRVSAYRLGPGGLNAEDGRRIAFHIRFNRASSLFARCWLLVEGETETWVINELARLCGHHFDAEGIKVIEFAQSGLKPLIKFARRMGIEWHVLVDGDEAGKNMPPPFAAC
jgi:putative ATP-dependent endonuclease of OLD family